MISTKQSRLPRGSRAHAGARSKSGRSSRSRVCQPNSFVVDFRLRRTTILLEQPVHHATEERMKYVLLVYGDEQQLDTMSSSEREALGNACLANNEALRQSGHLLAAEDLQSSRTATTVRVHNGNVSVTDGPYAPTKEQLIGLFFINAR